MVGEVSGFSLHAGVATQANERATKSRRPQASWNVCAVTSRGRRYPRNAWQWPAMAGCAMSWKHPGATARANRLAQGTSCATRKPYPSPSGATHVIFEPLDFMYRTYGMPRAHDCRDAGGRAMPGAIAEEAQERPYPGWLLWCPGPELTWPVSTACLHRIVNTVSR